MSRDPGSAAPESGVLGRDGQLLTGESLLVRYANFVKLPHTLFALPFACGCRSKNKARHC